MTATVPGTVATAFRAAGRPFGDLHAMDHWYRLETTLPDGAWLEFDGLATIAEIWIDGRLAAESRTMFTPLTVPIPGGGGTLLEICFRALRPLLQQRKPGPRARWRGRLTTEEGLRHYRTTLLGHMPGWSGDEAVIGPFRPIRLHEPRRDAPIVTYADLRTRLLPDGSGQVSLRLEGADLRDRPGSLTVAGRQMTLSTVTNGFQAELSIPAPPIWWPHTHGEPTTCAIEAEVDGCALQFGRVGFRTVRRRDETAGFGLLVNDVPVFCRGAIWAGLDATAAPPSTEALSSSLRHARDAGLNMLRVSGMTVYETPEFFELCDELGIMVWHDFMFARFDYPDTNEFIDDATIEARAFAQAVQSHPCLVVLCGGTEIAQTAAMSGCRPTAWRSPLFETTLADIAADECSDIPYVKHAPLGDGTDGLPFAAAAPVAHYFGVGAYQRPLDDLSTARVRFAAECLAFANIPDAASCHVINGNVPRDLAADWDFADIRDHYTEMMFEMSAPTTRRQDRRTWEDLGRATVALIMQQALTTWRTDDVCAGAIVLMWQDLQPGAGWGVVGSDGRPKSAWHALRSVCQPIQVLLRDLGLNGIVLHAINETGSARIVRLGLRGLRPDGIVETLGELTLELEARASRAVTATTLIGRWRDLANAWQFGRPGYLVLGATLDDADTNVRLSETAHFPVGPALPHGQPLLTTKIIGEADAWSLSVSSQGFAQFVQVDDDDWVPADNFFHLWPGETRVVSLHPSPNRTSGPCGTVSALNAHTPTHYGEAA